MHDFRTVQTTTIVGGGKQFSNSKSYIREENYDDHKLETIPPLPSVILPPHVLRPMASTSARRPSKQTAGGIQLRVSTRTTGNRQYMEVIHKSEFGVSEQSIFVGIILILVNAHPRGGVSAFFREISAFFLIQNFVKFHAFPTCG